MDIVRRYEGGDKVACWGESFDCVAACLLLTGADDGGLRNRSAEPKTLLRAGAAVHEQKLRPTNINCFTWNINLPYT